MSVNKAKIDEVREAVAALTGAELRTLRKVSTALARGLVNFTAEDLEQEAIVRTLQGKRAWRREEVSLVMHLGITMKSIAYAVRHRYENCAISLDSASGKGFQQVAPDSEAAAATFLAGLKDEVGADKDLSTIIELRSEGLTPLEIQQRLGWSRQHYGAAMRRLQRRWHRVSETKESTHA